MSAGLHSTCEAERAVHASCETTAMAWMSRSLDTTVYIHTICGRREGEKGCVEAMNVVLPSRQVQSRQMRLLGCVGLGQEQGLRQQKRMRARDSSWVHDSSRVQDISREYLREKRGVCGSALRNRGRIRGGRDYCWAGVGVCWGRKRSDCLLRVAELL